VPKKPTTNEPIMAHHANMIVDYLTCEGVGHEVALGALAIAIGGLFEIHEPGAGLRVVKGIVDLTNEEQPDRDAP